MSAAQWLTLAAVAVWTIVCMWLVGSIVLDIERNRKPAGWQVRAVIYWGIGTAVFGPLLSRHL